MNDIDVMLSDGYSRKHIFDHYTNKGMVSCQYAAFCRWIEKLSDRHPRKSKQSSTPIVTSTSPITEPAKPHPEQKKKSAVAKTADPIGLTVARPKMNRFSND